MPGVAWPRSCSSPFSKFHFFDPILGVVSTRGELGGTVFSGEQNPRQPVGMGKPRTRQLSCFTLHIVLEPATANTLSVDHQLGRVSIYAVGLDYAAGIAY